jgi:thiamine-phosphate pyrophosphorylase
MATPAPERAPDLFAISPGRGDADELEAKLPRLAEGGLRRFLLREKDLTPQRRGALARRLAPLCRTLGRTFGLEWWIAEDAELAAAVGATGVHLSERSPPPSEVRARDGRALHGDRLRIGLSIHADLARPPAELALCDHLFLAPLFPTPSKPGAKWLGADGFACLAAGLAAPTFALGGIERDHLLLLAARGVTRVAAIRLFFDAADPRRAVEEARALLAPRTT